jgi:hypothetical protein
MQENHGHHHGKHHPHPRKEFLEVKVHYPAATHPFIEHKASHLETVGTLKAKALEAFGLHEGGAPDGSTVTYTLYFHKQALEDANQTLGSLAGDDAEMTFKLAQQIVQG